MTRGGLRLPAQKTESALPAQFHSRVVNLYIVWFGSPLLTPTNQHKPRSHRQREKKEKKKKLRRSSTDGEVLLHILTRFTYLFADATPASEFFPPQNFRWNLQ